MWQAVEALLRKLDRWSFHRGVGHSLALHLRGEARPDGLCLVRVQNRLEIRWRARQVHPWDAGDRPESQSRLFTDQLLSDTESAIFRLFKALPQVDLIDLEVLEPERDTAIVAGTVARDALDTVGELRSVRMRLERLGVRCSALYEAPSSPQRWDAMVP